MTATPASFDLPAVVKLESCQQLHEFLTQSAARDVTIKCGAVERLHTLAAQMLLGAAKSWTADGHDLSLVDLTEACQKQLATLGIDQFSSTAEGSV